MQNRILVYSMLGIIWGMLMIPAFFLNGWFAYSGELGARIDSEKVSMTYAVNSPQAKERARRGYEQAVNTRQRLWLKVILVGVGGFILVTVLPLETIDTLKRWRQSHTAQNLW